MRKQNKICLLILAVTCLLTVCFPLSAQNNDISQVYSLIDKAFYDKSSQELSDALKSNVSSSSYNLYEAYALKKTRQLIIENDLEFARESSLAVIDNNLENFDAVDLYSYIDKAILNEQAQKQAEENRRKLEAERIAAQNERTKKQLHESYTTVSTKSGQAVYVSDQQASYDPIVWNVSLGIADFVFQKISDPDYSSLKYGLGFGANLFYGNDDFEIGADIFADMLMLTMGSGEEEVLDSAKFVPEIAFAQFNRNVFLRVGFAVEGLVTTSDVDTDSQGTFMTPVLGVGLDNVALGDKLFAAHIDYYPGSFAYSNLKAAGEAGVSLFVPLTVSERSKIGFKLGVSDLLFIKNEGIENRGKALFAIGVGNVNK